MLQKSPFYLLSRHFTQNAVLPYHLRIRVHRLDIPQRQGIEHRFMAVSRHNQLSPLRHAGQNGGKDAAAGSVNQKIRPIHIIELCVTLLRFFQDSFRLEQVVRARNLRNVTIHKTLQKRAISKSAI